MFHAGRDGLKKDDVGRVRLHEFYLCEYMRVEWPLPDVAQILSVAGNREESCWITVTLLFFLTSAGSTITMNVERPETRSHFPQTRIRVHATQR